MPDRDERQFRPEPDQFWTRWSLTNRGRLPASWATVLASDPLLTGARVVVDLALGGGARRVLLGPTGWDATAGVGGDSRLVAGELADEPVLDEALTVGEAGPSGRSIALSVAGRLVAADELLRLGLPLAGRGEVSLLAPGVSWDDRLVWLRGPLRGGVQFGHRDEFVDLSVEDPVVGEAEIPPWILDSDRWPNIPSSSVGQRVPIVVGRGFGPCPRIDSSNGGTEDDFVVAYGWGLEVEQVYVAGTLATLTTDYTVEEVKDGLGLPVTVIRLAAGAGSDEFAEVHAKVAESADRRRGLDLPAAVRRLLHEYGGFSADRLSDRLFAECQARVAAFGPATGTGSVPRVCVNQPVGSLEFVSTMLESYPYLSIVWDGAGLGLVASDHRATPCASLERGVYPIAERVEGGRYSETGLDDLRTAFTLRTQYNPVSDRFALVGLRRPSNNALCAMAQSLLGVDQAEGELTSVHIADASTQAFVLDWLVEHRCRLAYEVEVNAYPLAWFFLRLGDTVRWTDDDAGLSAAPAIVVGRTWSRGLVTIRLRVYPQTNRVGGSSLSYQ
jgi:hypothetical protein